MLEAPQCVVPIVRASRALATGIFVLVPVTEASGTLVTGSGSSLRSVLLVLPLRSLFLALLGLLLLLVGLSALGALATGRHTQRPALLIHSLESHIKETIMSACCSIHSTVLKNMLVLYMRYYMGIIPYAATMPWARSLCPGTVGSRCPCPRGWKGRGWCVGPRCPRACSAATAVTEVGKSQYYTVPWTMFKNTKIIEIYNLTCAKYSLMSSSSA